MVKEVNSWQSNLACTLEKRKSVHVFKSTNTHTRTHTDEMSCTHAKETSSKGFFNQCNKWYSRWPQEASLCLLCNSHPPSTGIGRKKFLFGPNIR